MSLLIHVLAYSGYRANEHPRMEKNKKEGRVPYNTPLHKSVSEGASICFTFHTVSQDNYVLFTLKELWRTKNTSRSWSKE